jgi:acyl-CoA thioesterase FadM
VECARELHWTRDLSPLLGSDPLDTIVRRLDCQFVRPVLVDSASRIDYRIIGLRRAGYELRFDLTSEREVCATANIVSVFYDATRHRVVPPPLRIARHLADTVLRTASSSTQRR